VQRLMCLQLVILAMQVVLPECPVDQAVAAASAKTLQPAEQEVLVAMAVSLTPILPRMTGRVDLSASTSANLGRAGKLGKAGCLGWRAHLGPTELLALRGLAILLGVVHRETVEPMAAVVAEAEAEALREQVEREDVMIPAGQSLSGRLHTVLVEVMAVMEALQIQVSTEQMVEMDRLVVVAPTKLTA
jgi:hypothetical protein